MTALEVNALVRQYQGKVSTVCHQLVPGEGGGGIYPTILQVLAPLIRIDRQSA